MIKGAHPAKSNAPEVPVTETTNRNKKEEVFKDGDSWPRIAQIISKLDLKLPIKRRFEYDFSALVKAVILKNVLGIKSNRKLALYLRSHLSESEACGFCKDINNNVKTPDRRTIDYVIRKHFDETLQKLIDSTYKKIKKQLDKFGLIPEPYRLKKLKVITSTNFQYQKEQKLKEVSNKIKQLISPHVQIRTKPNVKYNKNDILDVLIHTAIEHSFTNGGAKSYRHLTGKGPAPNTVLYRLSKENLKEIKDGFIAASDSMLREALRKKILKGRKFDVAVDTTFLHFYGKVHPDMVWSKEDRGTNKYFGFITLNIVEDGSRFVVYALPVFSGEKQSELVKELIEHAKKFIKINNFYADRGFANADMFKLLDEERVDYLIPLPDDGRIRKLISTLKPPFVVKDYMRGGYRIPSVILVEGSKGLMKLATNKKINRSDVAFLNRLPGLYSKRWGIETSYRMEKKEGLVRTTSRNYKLRYFFFMFSILLYNMWILISLLTATDLNAKDIKKCVITFKFLLKNLYGDRPSG
jgi:putative transposase